MEEPSWRTSGGINFPPPGKHLVNSVGAGCFRHSAGAICHQLQPGRATAACSWWTCEDTDTKRTPRRIARLWSGFPGLTMLRAVFQPFAYRI